MTPLSLIATTPRAAVLLGDDAVPELTTSIREALVDETGLDGLLEILQTRGTRDLPSFVCAAFEDKEVRLLLRGDFSVTVRGGKRDGDRIAPSRTLATWLEDVVPAPAALTFDHRGEEALLWAGTAVPGGASLARDPEPAADHVPESPPVKSASEPAPPSDDATGALATPAPGRPADDTLIEMEPTPEQPAVPGPDAPDHTVRQTPTADPGPDGGLPPLPPTPPRVHEAEQGPGVHGDEEDARQQSQRPGPAPDAPVASQPSPPPVTASPPAPPPPDPGGLIQGVPRFGSSGTPGSPASPEQQSQPRSPSPGDHDGLTVSRDHVRQLVEHDDSSEHGMERTTSGVPSVVCPQGHANPPHSRNCQSCNSDLANAPVQHLPRPTVARLRIDNGDDVELDRSQIVGRQPMVATDSSLGDLVGLVTIPDHDKQLSRSHAEIRVDGWTMTVTDLGSMNGTWVQLPGQERVRIRPHTPTPVIIGTVVNLADVATIVFEEPQ